MNSLKCGDEVAVLPQMGAAPRDVLDIAIVAYAGSHLIEVADGRIFYADDGRSFHDMQDECIVPATEVHRSAFRAKLH